MFASVGVPGTDKARIKNLSYDVWQINVVNLTDTGVTRATGRHNNLYYSCAHLSPDRD